MSFIIFKDESLESFLLRLCHFHGFERFSHFAEELLYRTLDHKEAMAGALPTRLSRINIFHSKVTSQRRVAAFLQLENELNIEKLSLLKMSLMTSKALFSPQYTAVHRDGVDYPRALVRKSATPICPECLKYAPYIRQHWQFIPYQACHQHQCMLIHCCPECGAGVDYQYEESIEECRCGFNLTKCQTTPADEAPLAVANWLMQSNQVSLGLPEEMTRSQRYGFFFWYVNQYGDENEISYADFVNFASTWPANFYQQLDAQIAHAEIVRVNPWKTTFFKTVFGDLLLNCRHLPSRNIDKNIVLQALLHFLSERVLAIPAKNKASVAEVLLSPLEASTLLSCTNEEIYRLYDHGELKAVNQPRIHTKLNVHQSTFSLRSIIELRLVRMCSETDGLSLYLPHW